MTEKQVRVGLLFKIKPKEEWNEEVKPETARVYYYNLKRIIGSELDSIVEKAKENIDEALKMAMEKIEKEAQKKKEVKEDQNTNATETVREDEQGDNKMIDAGDQRESKQEIKKLTTLDKEQLEVGKNIIGRNITKSIQSGAQFKRENKRVEEVPVKKEKNNWWVYVLLMGSVLAASVIMFLLLRRTTERKTDDVKEEQRYSEPQPVTPAELKNEMGKYITWGPNIGI